MECYGPIIAKEDDHYIEVLDRLIQSSNSISNTLEKAIEDLRGCLLLIKRSNSKLEEKAKNT